MVNKWVEFVKKFSSDNKVNYKIAMTSDKCKAEYKELQNINKCIEAKKFSKSDNCKDIYIDKEDKYDDFLLKDIKKKRKERNDDMKKWFSNKEENIINDNKENPESNIKQTSKFSLVKFQKQKAAEKKLIKAEKSKKLMEFLESKAPGQAFGKAITAIPNNDMIGSGYNDVKKKVKIAKLLKDININRQSKKCGQSCVQGCGIIGDIAGSIGGIGATMLTANPIGTMVGSYAGNKIGNKLDEILGTGKSKKPKILVVSGGSLYPG